jgi:hypothetical protein
MNFIERFFGFASVLGDGSLEAVLLIGLVVIIAGLGLAYLTLRLTSPRL